MSSTQMLKGILEGCLLAVISEGEIYGYEMTKVLAGYGFSDISEGSIYPILLRMQKEKWVETELKRSASGPKRKYYRLTPLGEAELRSFIGRWKALSGNVNALLEKKLKEK
ncbi:PadR family transcriptional regulator [Bacillus paralicheniformis]|jgi:PadR family transcriptional regulator PadR|uniref:PadR family transcriptional regulator n=1 Tax=Bacillus paralicheniformis TaxID=1648923 RepID=A0A6I7TWL0_9BACI|nr:MULTISPECIES: PadR family transcriptional regulator [Bacillus]ETB71093.1 PadR family transcriptional regulator [Bacillus sp. CPSM8]KJD52837.1 PadR family transcriptional regulator [Bacillus amyloliquefaciens]KUL06070.1 PadR family transcriptional regulator [Bacillus licheniformis LMG 7559]KUL16434.1 PadR family transcriptional regulator [Bacillus licheniformis LMG 6934]MBC8622286.1 helix-turn-helix transcriptional regulator [Robertmurraya crescens]POO83188.1 PadR family transcriptional reg